MPIASNTAWLRITAGLANPLIAGIQDQVRAGLVQPPARELGQAFVELHVDRADRRGREAVAAQLLGDRLDLAGRHALDVHLGQRRHERLLGALVAFEQLGREAAGAVLRHSELQLADPGDQGAIVVAAAVAEARRRSLALLGTQRRGHLGFQQLLQHRLHQRTQEVAILGQRAFTSSRVGLSLPRGMVCILRVTSTSPAYHDPAPILHSVVVSV